MYIFIELFNKFIVLINECITFLVDFFTNEVTLATFIGAFLASLFGIFSYLITNYIDKKSCIRKYSKILYTDIDNLIFKKKLIESHIKSDIFTYDKVKKFEALRKSEFPLYYCTLWRDYLANISGEIDTQEIKSISSFYEKIELLNRILEGDKYEDLEYYIAIGNIDKEFKATLIPSLFTEDDLKESLLYMSKKGRNRNFRWSIILNAIKLIFFIFKNMKRIEKELEVYLEVESYKSDDDIIQWLLKTIFNQKKYKNKTKIRNYLKRYLFLLSKVSKRYETEGLKYRKIPYHNNNIES